MDSPPLRQPLWVVCLVQLQLNCSTALQAETQQNVSPVEERACSSVPGSLHSAEQERIYGNP